MIYYQYVFDSWQISNCTNFMKIGIMPQFDDKSKKCYSNYFWGN